MTLAIVAVIILALLLTAVTLRLLWLEGECWRLRVAKAYYLELINDLILEDE